MRILLGHNSLYYPAHGGGDKSNRLLMSALAARGHECRVVARMAEFSTAEHEKLLGQLADRNVPVLHQQGGSVHFQVHGVDVHVATSHPQLRSYFARHIAEFQPDAILCSTDDPAQLMLMAALESAAKVIYLARATLALPFGPDCAFPSKDKTDALRQVDAITGVSQYVADYIQKHSGIPAVHVPISLMDPGPYEQLGRFDSEFVTMVNPCGVKGISIFCALAERMPAVRFAAVPTWGTNAGDLAALRRYPNIEILEPVDRIDDLLARTRVLLVPSLWAEARSRIVVEAMLRGVPVMASNIGGIPEAKMGVPYLVPVRPIERYRPQMDENMVPVADLPEQDITPWEQSLGRLLTDQDHYEEVAAASRRVSAEYAQKATVEPFEFLLTRVQPKTRAKPAPKADLSAEKRALLALRLHKRLSAGGPEWFPGVRDEAAVRLRLFCFPYAGGGTTEYKTWAESLPNDVQLVPVRLPGRETRLHEKPIEDMHHLVLALADVIPPYTETRFAFFGHSMGAGIAFELARELRRRGMALPAALLVSSARAPRFRLGLTPQPPPSDEELIEQIDRLQGMPREMLAIPEVRNTLLPILRADTTLYRNYAYTPDAPLDLPITAYWSESDPNLQVEHMLPWREVTTREFVLHSFPGGHFYFRQYREKFLDELRRAVDHLLGD